MRSVTFAQSFQRSLCALGFAGLAALTLVDKGATRMFSSPWWLLLWFVQLAPVAALLVRAALDRRPFSLPPASWFWLGNLWVLVELAAALASPFRAQSLLAAAMPVAAWAAFLLLFDWLHDDAAKTVVRRRLLGRMLGWLFVAVLVDSLGLWLADVVPLWLAGRISSFRLLFNFRNEHPLGHSNYTAGLALFMLPWLTALAGRARGRARAGWSAAGAAALFMLFTSGSRGGMVGLAVLLLAALVWFWRNGILQGRQAVVLAGAALLLAGIFALINPRILGLLKQETSPGPPDISTVQRSAMLAAGLDMGADRPLLGFGPGVTPLVYPRYRARLDGGVEIALQLHSTPLQLWADTGAPGLACACALAALVAGALWRNRAAAAPGLALAGYAAFALTDFQLDVPMFAFLVAACAAACAPPPGAPASRRVRHGLALAMLGCAAVITALGRSDPAPLLNVEALALGRDPAKAGRAVALLKQSLALNPDQGIAQLNLGWLLVARDPPAAERHFLAAAHLWPDKAGVYFGLGLARLNQGHSAAAVKAFALECVNDPVFIVSPWWRVAALAPLRAPTGARVAQIYGELSVNTPRNRWPGSEVRYAAALNAWLLGKISGRAVAAAATTPERRDFFQRNPMPGPLLAAPVRRLRYEELGYPVLMRNSNLPPPVDLYDAQENALATGRLAFLFPAKGWLPSPRLLEYLDNPDRPQK